MKVNADQAEGMAAVPLGLSSLFHCGVSSAQHLCPKVAALSPQRKFQSGKG
jgi:hypothetical protein